MSSRRLSHQKRDDSATEETPLLSAQIPVGPSTTDASPEAGLKHASNGTPNGHMHDKANSRKTEHTAASQTLTLTRGALVTFALGCLIFLQATNISMLTTIQSDIAGDLDAFEVAIWFTSAYLIAMSSLAPLNGKLASVFGPRICIFVSSIVLAIGSSVSSIANGYQVFILGRCITGIGASGVFTISIIITLELTGSQRRGIAIGMLNSGYTIGVAAGATAAGALLSLTGWRPLFWMQAPISILGGTILLFAIPQDFHAGTKYDGDATTWKRVSQLDYVGALTLTASIILLLYPLSSPRGIPLLPIGLSLLVLAIFLLNEIHFATDPIIPIALLRSRALLLTCLGTVGYMMARWCVLFYSPTYALAVRHWSPASAGSILIPTNTGFALGGLLVGALHIKRPGSFYAATVTTYALFPLTLLALAALATECSPVWLVILVVFACGAVTGAALNYNLAHLLHMTPKHTHYIATSLLATFRGFAGSFGSAIGGGLFSRTLYASLERGFEEEGLNGREDLVRRLLGSPALVGKLEGVERRVAVEGYQDALRALWLAGAGLAAVTVLVQAGTGWKGVGEKEAEAEGERDVGVGERNERR